MSWLIQKIYKFAECSLEHLPKKKNNHGKILNAISSNVIFSVLQLLLTRRRIWLPSISFLNLSDLQKLKLRLQKIAPRPFVTVSLSFYFFISPFPRILAPPPLIFFSRNVKCTFKLFWRVFNLNKALMRIMFYFCRDLRKWKKFSDDLGKIKSKHFEKQKKKKQKLNV